MTYAHPVELARGEALEADFFEVLFTRCEEARWHFKARLPKGAALAPGGETPPSHDEPLARLALAHCGAAEIEVFGYLLEREVDPADFLDSWLGAQGVDVVSARDLATDGGAAGDAVGTFKVEDVAWVGRHFAAKWGDRMYLLVLRAPAEHYAKYADDFFAILSTFDALDQDGSILAEDARLIAGDAPLPWSLLLPCSWIAQPDARSAELQTFRASMIPFGASRTELLFGKMIFGVSTPKVWKSSSGPIETFVEALEDKGVRVEPAELEEVLAPKPFLAAHRLVAPAVLDRGVFKSIPCEVRAKVLTEKRARFFAMTFAPAREIGAFAWMQAKRTLDVLSLTLDLDAKLAPSAL